MRAALKSLERLLLPNACVACERVVGASDPDALFCGVCTSRLRRVGSGCERCAQPLPPVGGCRFCAPWPRALGNTRSAVWLTETARELVHHFKYEGLTKLGESAAAIMVRCLRRPSGVLVPVPLAPEKARSRGYNQAVVLAHALAARWRLQVDETVVQRTQSARSQTALTPHARRVNVSGAFVARRAPPHAPSAVILVDDILTTGATISAVAGALESAGWEHISAVTFARAMPYGTRLGLET